MTERSTARKAIAPRRGSARNTATRNRPEAAVRIPSERAVLPRPRSR